MTCKFFFKIISNSKKCLKSQKTIRPYYVTIVMLTIVRKQHIVQKVNIVYNYTLYLQACSNYDLPLHIIHAQEVIVLFLNYYLSSMYNVHVQDVIIVTSIH